MDARKVFNNCHSTALSHDNTISIQFMISNILQQVSQIVFEPIFEHLVETELRFSINWVGRKQSNTFIYTLFMLICLVWARILSADTLCVLCTRNVCVSRNDKEIEEIIPSFTLPLQLPSTHHLTLETPRDYWKMRMAKSGRESCILLMVEKRLKKLLFYANL